MGFLIINDSNKSGLASYINKIEGLKVKNKKKYIDEIEKGLTKDVCWICDGWYEKVFTFDF